ncbi:UNVERIFIED_CONTAM: hypothetical protein Scaly_0443500 [Sesamum calycinum]|uniref:Uncharacterized protein n=1 Tax=Sesamum calycinum TaxID=2727403 RepID=A0AAW2SEM6_9LAMI
MSDSSGSCACLLHHLTLERSVTFLLRLRFCLSEVSSDLGFRRYCKRLYPIDVRFRGNILQISFSGVEMNGTSRNGKNCNFDKTHPGCLGRMVNLFELNIGVSANKLLTDKPHSDGSPVSRSRSDVSSLSSPSVDQIEDKVTGLSAAKPTASGNPGENQDQPSPISVLDPLRE